MFGAVPDTAVTARRPARAVGGGRGAAPSPLPAASVEVALYSGDWVRGAVFGEEACRPV